jgi:hypothetical protein
LLQGRDGNKRNNCGFSTVETVEAADRVSVISEDVSLVCDDGIFKLYISINENICFLSETITDDVFMVFISS